MTQRARLKWFSKKIIKELDLGNFDEKITIQKAVYIAQNMGMGFNYNFGWYVRGVYSSSLTVDMYDVIDMYDVSVSSYHPSEKDETIVNRLLSIHDAIGTMFQTFELVSSVMYAKIKRNMDEKDTKKFIKSVMPWFLDTDIDKAIEIITIIQIKTKQLMIKK